MHDDDFDDGDNDDDGGLADDGGGDGPKPADRARDPAAAAREQSDGYRLHAEIAAVFEGPRKYDAAITPGLDPDLARDLQRTVGRLGNGIIKDGPVLTGPAAADANRLLQLPTARGLAVNDYHVHRRPGEVMVVRWLAGADQTDAFYDRLQAHYDAAMDAHKEDERQAYGWRQDPVATAYRAALDGLTVDMPDRYLRDVVRRGKATVMSTLAADEMNIAYLCDHVMGVTVADVVGRAAAPPADPKDRDLAWYFKLFSLRGPGERMCFFTFLQKSDDNDW